MVACFNHNLLKQSSFAYTFIFFHLVLNVPLNCPPNTFQTLRIGQLTKWQTMWGRIWSEKLSRFLFLHFRSILFLSVWISQTCYHVSAFGQSDNRFFFFSGRNGEKEHSLLHMKSVISCFSVKYDSKVALSLCKTGLIFAFVWGYFIIISFLKLGEIQTFSSQFYLEF